LYNILIEFGIPKDTSKANDNVSNETYSGVRVGKHLSDMFPIKNGLKKEMLFRHCYSTLL
jgi:hypothetical protein